MSKLRVHSFSISLDGYGAGPNQSPDNPLGVGADKLHDWVIATRTWRRMHGSKGGRTGIDDEFMARGTVNIGAWIMGRNMFDPVRGTWSDDTWRGWWATDPPFHTPVCAHPLCERANPMEGGTTFYFVTDGIEAALAHANDAAKAKTCWSAAESRRSGNIFRRNLSMKCTSPLRRSSSDLANTSLPIWTCRHSVISVRLSV